MENITIRSLDCSDLPSVAKLHIRAFSDRALASLGQEAVRRYYEWQLIGPHDAIALGIFQGKTLAGFCFAGVFRGALSGYLRRNRRFLVWRVVTHPWLLLAPFFRERMYLAWDVLGQGSYPAASQAVTSKKSFGILAIAVDPQTQGVGLGKRLMEETEKRAIERGFSHLHLSVDINNRQAVAFYERLGWHKLFVSSNVWNGSMAKDIG